MTAAMLRLTIDGAASTQMLLRVLNLIAQRDLVPSHLDAMVDGDKMRVRIALAAAPPPVIEIVTAKISALVEVTAVEIAVSKMAQSD